MGYTARVLHSLCSELHVREVIRRGGYRSRQDIHKLIANAYALLTDRRRQELLEGPFMPVHRDPESGVVLYTWTSCFAARASTHHGCRSPRPSSPRPNRYLPEAPVRARGD